MGVTADDVRRVAELARLELTDEEVSEFVRDLGAILGHVEALQEVAIPEDRDRVRDRPGHGRPAGEPLHLRPDEPDSEPLATPTGDFARGFRDGFFTVPRLASHGPGHLAERPDGDPDAGADGT